MWQSVWDVTSIIMKELWMTLLKMWELVQLWFSSSERFEIQKWLEKYLPYVPDDFSDSWRDGRLLAILLNKLHPGCFPDAHQLDPDYGLRNVYKAFGVLEVYFGIKPSVSVEEIVTCIEGSDTKFFGILLQLKQLTENQPENVPPETAPKENNEQHSISQSCIAKGTGLAVGFVGRIANFIIFCSCISDIDVVIEIRGPNTICSERITKRSPKKKRSMSTWDCPRPLIRSMSFNDYRDGLTTEEDDNLERRIISTEYEIIGNQICVGYKPKEKGQHKVSIMWHGQHVSDSPYFVTVEDPSKITTIINIKSALKTANESEKTESRKNSVRFQESQVRYKEGNQPLGRVLSRRVLRYIVKINGKDIPVSAESTETLATELLKMEYDIETCPSLHRRNSWGFTGDAERKKSVIRQFGIDVNELEAQLCLRRSRSLSVNPGAKRLLEKSDSFGSITQKLNIVNEDIFECCEQSLENESDYAYINENVTPEEKETKNNEEPEMQVNTAIEGDTESFEHPGEHLQDQSARSADDISGETFAEKEFKEISSLSTETTQVDNSNEDLELNISFNISASMPDHSYIETTVRTPFNCESSNSELKRCNNNNNNHTENEKNISETSKYLRGSLRGKTGWKCYKNKKYQVDKKCSKTKKDKKSTKRTCCNKSPTNTVTPDTAVRNVHSLKKPVFKTKEYTPLKLSECLQHLDKVKLKNQRKQTDTDQHVIDTHSVLSDIRGISDSFSITDKLVGQNNPLSIEERCSKTEEESKVSYANPPFRNIINSEVSKNYGRVQQCEIQEPEIKKIVLNHTLCTSVPPLTPSEIKTKGASVEESRALRTHTLRTIEQFNFKQFNPSADPENCNSPVKSQIVQWESALSSDNQKSTPKRTNSSETEQVSIKEKLAFWEKASKTKQNSLTQTTIENNRRINLLDNIKSPKPLKGSTNAVRNDLYNEGTGNKSSISVVAIKEKTDARISINKETNLAAKKDIDYKITPELRLSTDKIRRRSFSDPGVFEITAGRKDDLSDLPSLESSTTDYFYSSNDDNLEQYLSEDSQDSEDDYAEHSTGDEYIDDEISGSTSEYWGDLSVLRGLKVAQCSIDQTFPEDDFLQNHHLQLKSFPDECKVFGIAVYYGYVAEKNRFKVYTGDAGFGNLSVSMQGFRSHDVSLVSVAYVRKDIYEVTYQVMTSGYYLISVRWMDKEVRGSPFVCKVTF